MFENSRHLVLSRIGKYLISSDSANTTKVRRIYPSKIVICVSSAPQTTPCIQIPAEWQQVLHKFASLVNEGWPLLKARTEALRDLPAAFSEETSSTTSATNNQHTSVQTSSTKANTQLPYIDATFSEMKKSLSDKDFIDAVRYVEQLRSCSFVSLEPT